MFRRFLRTDDDVSGLVMRLTLALVFFPHGAQKLLGWWGGPGASATIQNFYFYANATSDGGTESYSAYAYYGAMPILLPMGAASSISVGGYYVS